MSSIRLPLVAALAALIGVLSPSLASAQQVAKDHGKTTLRAPTPEEQQALADAISALTAQDPSGTIERTLPNGATVVEFVSGYQSVAIGAVGANGVETTCVTPGDAQPSTPALEEE